VKPEIQGRYFDIFARHATGEHPASIASALGVAIRTVYRALRWVANNRLTLELPERLALAICEKRAHLAHLAGKRKKLESESAFNSLIGLEKLIAQIHSEVLELEGILQHVRKNPPENEQIELDIRIVKDDDWPYYRKTEERDE
jgi:hypothetical protein